MAVCLIVVKPQSNQVLSTLDKQEQTYWYV